MERERERERECLGYYWKLLKFKKREDILLLSPFVRECLSKTIIKLQIQTQKGFFVNMGQALFVENHKIYHFDIMVSSFYFLY